MCVYTFFSAFQLQVAESRCRVASAEKEKLESTVHELEKEKKASEKKLTQQQSRLTKLTAELKEEKEVSPPFLHRDYYIQRCVFVWSSDEQVSVDQSEVVA